VPLGNLDNMEEQMIIRALEQTGGHRAHAAEQLESLAARSAAAAEYEIDTRGSEGLANWASSAKISRSFFAPKSICP